MGLLSTLNIIYIVLIIIGFTIFCYVRMIEKKNTFQLTPKNKKNPSICILIPARYESKVIEGLFQSIQEQTYQVNMKDVYVIIESKDDPTYELSKKYHVTPIIRKRLDLKRKGYALDEAIQYLKEKKKVYDLYFIFDADNILKEDFIEQMIPYYQKGYDITLGYRNCKNGNESMIASCSTMTFSMLNTLINQSKINYHGNIILSGTGYFVTQELIQEWNGFPFHSLTEDYEMTLHSILHGYKMYYNIDAEFYDEQPITYQQSKKQRIRWIKGFINARKKYIPLLKEKLKHNPKNPGSIRSEMIGVIPYIFMVTGVILFILQNLMTAIACFIIGNPLGLIYLIYSIGMVFIIYAVLLIFSTYLLDKEKTTLNLTETVKINTIICHPFFLVTYVPCALHALFRKNIGWDRIEHRVTNIK
ncbi:MAG: glycosyltransferase [Firmicutes bacterium]|nr:glycosyltransferase [Bacillota bacterium]